MPGNTMGRPGSGGLLVLERGGAYLMDNAPLTWLWGYTASKGRFCHAVTSGIIFSLILLASSGEMSRWLITTKADLPVCP